MARKLKLCPECGLVPDEANGCIVCAMTVPWRKIGKRKIWKRRKM